MDTVGGSKNCPFKTKYTDLTFAPTATGRKTKTARAYHAWSAHGLRVQVATQTAPALEFVAQVKGASVGVGMQSMHETWDERVSSRLHTDSSVSKGIASRVELGKIRHLDTGLLWVQHHVSRRNVQTHKVAGPENGADIGTKDLNAETLVKLMKAMNFEEMAGRHPRALEIVHDQKHERERGSQSG